MKKIVLFSLVLTLSTHTLFADEKCDFYCWFDNISNRYGYVIGRSEASVIRPNQNEPRNNLKTFVPQSFKDYTEEVTTVSRMEKVAPNGLKKYLETLIAGKKYGDDNYVAPEPPDSYFEPDLPRQSKDFPETVPDLSNQQTAKEFQSFLNSQGANLKVDGNWGPRSQTALEKFQKTNGIDAKTFGKLDAKTLEKIDELADKQLENNTISRTSPKDKESGSNPTSCSESRVEGDTNNILGCGKATNFGHLPDGSKDPNDDGQTFCNPKNDPEKFTYLPPHSNGKKPTVGQRNKEDNLNYCYAALRAVDIAKIIGIPTTKTVTAKKNGKTTSQTITKDLSEIKKDLANNRNKFCERELRITNKENGKIVNVKLLDIMSNNDKAIDLTGGCMLKLGVSKNNSQPTLNSVQIEWANQPSKTQTASLSK